MRYGEEQPECPRWIGVYGARANVEDVAKILNFSVRDVRLLTSLGILKPLGKPQNNATKFYATTEIMKKVEDAKWLNKATTLCQKDHYERANGKAINESDCAKN